MVSPSTFTGVRLNLQRWWWNQSMVRSQITFKFVFFSIFSGQNYCIRVKHQLKDFKCVNNRKQWDGKAAALFPRCFPSRLVFHTAHGESPKEETCHILWVQRFCCGLSCCPCGYFEDPWASTSCESISALFQQFCHTSEESYRHMLEITSDIKS